MTKNILFKLGAPILALSLVAGVAGCGAVDEEDPIGEEPIEDEAPLNLDDYNDSNVPTENEMNDDFGKELDEDKDAEKDIPENYLESDEETESSS